MPPILPSGTYTIGLPAGTETHYIGPLKDNPDTIGILPGDLDPRPIFTLDNVDGVDEYNISIDGRWVDKKENGELCLERPGVDVSKKWKIVRKGEEYVIKGDSGEETCWSATPFPPQNLNGFQAIGIRHTCPECTDDCRCGPGNKCKCVGDSKGCVACEPTNVGFRNGCSGCPSPCARLRITRITE